MSSASNLDAMIRRYHQRHLKAALADRDAYAKTPALAVAVSHASRADCWNETKKRWVPILINTGFETGLRMM